MYRLIEKLKDDTKLVFKLSEKGYKEFKATLKTQRILTENMNTELYIEDGMRIIIEKE